MSKRYKRKLHSNQSKNPSKIETVKNSGFDDDLLTKGKKIYSGGTVDQFGQFRRNANQYVNGELNSKSIWNKIGCYLKNIFSPHSFLDVIRLILFGVYLLSTFFSNGSSLVAIITHWAIATLFWVFIEICFSCIRARIHLWFNAFGIVGFVIIILLANYASVDKVSNRDKVPYEADFKKAKDKSVQSRTFVALANKNIYNIELKRIGKLTKYQTCEVIGIRGEVFYKIFSPNEKHYVTSENFIELTELVAEDLKKDKLRDHFVKYSNSINVKDSLVYRPSKGGTYWGTLNRQGYSDGEGSYQWFRNSQLDSIYIGQWHDGIIHGSGILYNYKKRKYKSGIWLDNKLIDTLNDVNSDEVIYKLDSVTNLKNEIQEDLLNAGYIFGEK